MLAQTFTDFELLLIDDCSPDDSAAVIESYDDSRIRLVRNERNLGQIATTNRGLATARGEYVARLDQDDRCLPQRLERQVAILDAEPNVVLVSGWMTVVDEHGNQTGTMKGELDDYASFVFSCLTNRVPVGHSAAMFRREIVLALGGYDESFPLAEDQYLWRRIALARGEARVVPEPVTVWLAHSSSQSQRGADVQLESGNRAYELFVTALSDRVSARTVRLLLTWDQRLWDECRTREAAQRIADGLDSLLNDASERLRLTEPEAAKLDALVRARVGLAARRSWRSGVIRHWRTSPPLRRFAGESGVTFGTVSVLAPILRPAYLVIWPVLDALSAPGRLKRPKSLVRRSPRLVDAYTQLRSWR